MTVKEILEIIPKGVVVNVYQTPISRIDNCSDPVHRQTGEVSELIHANQNYLDFNAVKLQQHYGLMTITCTARAEQEMAIINALYNGK